MTNPNDAEAENSVSEQALNKKDASNLSETSRAGGAGRRSKGNHRKGRSRHERGSKREPREFKLTSEGLQRHFLACQNCCYFLTGIQVIYGRDVNQRFLANFDGKWFQAPLSSEVKQLLEKTFGLGIDNGLLSIDHACSICCRRYVIELEPADIPVLISETQAENSPERKEPIIFEEPRTRDERLTDWDANGPKLLFEFKRR